MTKILIVDDHPDIRQLIRLTLGNQYEIHEASDATSALRLAREHRPHVVVMDIMMPGEMDGLQALQAIRSDAALTETKVIMVTARASANDQATALEYGAHGYFCKPFSPVQLVNSIKGLIV
jgi:DNA-binding response OmpR family regulator